VGAARDKFNNASGETPNVQIEGAGTSAAGLYMLSMTANNTSASTGAGPTMFFGRSEGATTGSYTVVSADKNLGRISFQGADGTEFVEAAKIDCFVDGTPGANDMPGRLVFSTTADGASSPTERMRIWNTGDVSFNGTNVTTSNGNTGNSYKFFGGANSVNIITESTGANRALNIEYRRTGRSTERASQITIGENPSNQGEVVVYSSSANAGVSGGVILQNAATSWASNSDIRLKNVIGSIENALEGVSALSAIKFTWKSDPSGSPQVGLTAQSVQQVIPEAVGTTTNIADPDDATEYLSVRYTEVIPLLVAALQESKERIETLEAKVAALEAQ
jgi:hypothetical protein